MSEKQTELYTGAEWKDEQLAGELDGEWVEAKEGLTIEGKLVRAFCTAQNNKCRRSSADAART